MNVTKQWPTQPSVFINLGERRINLPTAALAIVVEVNQHTFKDSGVAIDLARRVVIVNDYETLYDVQISMNALTILKKSLIDRSTRLESERPLKSYAKLIKTLATRLTNRYCIFYNRESTLEALRFAQPRERTIDLA